MITVVSMSFETSNSSTN